MKALRDLLNPSRLTAIVDIGANPIDGHPPYRTMLEEGLCSLIGFEPIVEAINNLNARKGDNETYLPYIIGDGGDHTLHLTRAPGMVSLLRPDATRLPHYERFAWLGHIEGTMLTSTVRLDDLVEVPAVDMLKMDIQGAELMVLQHAGRHLANAVAVMTEMSFAKLYECQPTFGEIDGELRKHGFVPHCFADAKCWPIVTEIKVPSPSPHQLLEADMVYVRDFTQPMQAEQWKHLALIAHCVCASYDLAMLAVEMAAKLDVAPPDAPVRYAKLLEAQ